MERGPALVLADAIDAGLNDARATRADLTPSHLHRRIGEAVEALHSARDRLHDVVRAWDALDGVAPRQERRGGARSPRDS